jgi:hypothetical protein
MPEGRLKNSFLDRSNSSREEKPPKSTELVACSEKPQLRSFSFPNTLQIVEVGVSRKAEIQEEFGEGRYGNFCPPSSVRAMTTSSHTLNVQLKREIARC